MAKMRTGSPRFSTDRNGRGAGATGKRQETSAATAATGTVTTKKSSATKPAKAGAVEAEKEKAEKARRQALDFTLSQIEINLTIGRQIPEIFRNPS